MGNVDVLCKKQQKASCMISFEVNTHAFDFNEQIVGEDDIVLPAFSSVLCTELAAAEKLEQWRRQSSPFPLCPQVSAFVASMRQIRQSSWPSSVHGNRDGLRC